MFGKQYGVKIPPTHALAPWMPSHAAWTQTRFQPKASGRIVYLHMRGENYNLVVVPFGECILYKVDTDDKYEDR